MKTKTKVLKKWNTLKINPIFWIGLALFCVGLAGMFSFFRGGGKLDRIFTDNAIIVTEFKLDSQTAQKFAELFPQTDFGAVFYDLADNKFGIEWEKDIAPWIGGNGGFALFPQGDFILAAEYRSRSKAEKFAELFKIPSEEFQIQEVRGGEIWTPAFSSDIALGFSKGYFFFSTSKTLLQENFLDSQKIAQNEKYKEVQKDLPHRWLAHVFVDTEKFAQHFANGAKFASQKPLLQAFSQSIPGVGMTLGLQDGALSVDTKFLAREGVFAERDVSRDANQTMPELAQFAPQNVLFFMNGSDIYQKYVHTKQFLENFHPQFSVIFDGVLRGISRQYFGEKFDFEKDLLARLHGQYAVVLDIEDTLNPFVHFSLITGFGGPDMEKNLSELHDVIHFAQSQFSTQKKTVELPDGTTREELVAVDAANIPIQKKEFEGVTYFTAENITEEKQFSYTFMEGYFLFSTYEKGIQSFISTYQGNSESLAQNEDFRESVLFRYSPSESYGFFNVEKLASVLDFLSESETEKSSIWINFLRSGVRNFTVSRKVFPESVFWTGTLFLR